MPWIEKEGRTVEEARAAAVASAGLPEADLEIEVIREGAKGLFGLGGEPALVRVRPRSEAVDVREAFKGDLGTPVTAGSTTDAAAASEERPDTRTAPPDEDEEGAEDREQAASEVGVEMVRGILKRMELDGEVNSRVSAGTVYIEVSGEDMGILIGRGGATLEALQELVRAGVRRRVKARQAVVVDVEGYWERRRGRRRGGQHDDQDD